jgi:hypothetical protein
MTRSVFRAAPASGLCQPARRRPRTFERLGVMNYRCLTAVDEASAPRLLHRSDYGSSENPRTVTAVWSTAPFSSHCGHCTR